MTIAEMVYSQVKQLPEPLARLVLDFVVNLRDGREWCEPMPMQEGGLASMWHAAEDDVWDHL